MIIKLFDIQNDKVVPTEHCYTLKFLKDIMDEYPDDYLQVYAYLFYMTCPNPDLNPFFNIPETDKEEVIMEEVGLTLSPEEVLIVEGINKCKQLYETPTFRAYTGIKTMLDRLADYMYTTEITHGRDGNINSLVNAAAKFDQIRASYRGAFNDMKDEQKSTVRGGSNLAYDQ